MESNKRGGGPKIKQEQILVMNRFTSVIQRYIMQLYKSYVSPTPRIIIKWHYQSQQTHLGGQNNLYEREGGYHHCDGQDGGERANVHSSVSPCILSVCLLPPFRKTSGIDLNFGKVQIDTMRFSVYINGLVIFYPQDIYIDNNTQYQVNLVCMKN